MAKSKALSVRIEDDLQVPLRQLAKQDDRSVGYLVKVAIRQYLERRLDKRSTRK